MDSPSGSGCRQCGTPSVAGEDGCKLLFQEVVGREFSRPELFHIHRVTVDAYSLQHPDRYMKSAKSAVAHLAGMCWTLEESGDPSVSQALSRFLDGTPRFERPHPIPPAGARGELTILDIHSAPDSGAHVRLVKRWAASAWEAWAEHHPKAREWVKAARKELRRRSGR